MAPAFFNVTSLADSNVPGSGSLRRAITDSNNTPGPNQIHILVPGPYMLTLPGVENNNTGGDLDILNNKVDIDNQSGGTVVIDAGSLPTPDRVLDIAQAGNEIGVTITGVTIQGGNLSPGGSNTNGGGIRVFGLSSLTLNNVIVQNNHAPVQGGGISTDGGNLTLNGTTVRHNISSGGGGLYSASGRLTITSSLFDDNSSMNSGGGGGGGIYLASTGDVTITGSEVAHNQTDGVGGGLFNSGDARLTISSCTFDGNSAGKGGGGLCFSTSLPSALSNVTISGNSSATSGGGLLNLSAGVIDLVNDTIAFNSATMTGGGVFSSPSLNLGGLILHNTIVARNTATVHFPDVDNNGHAGGLTDLEGNFIGDNAGASDSFTAGTPNNRGSFVGPASFNAGTGGVIFLPLDPLLEPLADNGGTVVLPDGSHPLTHKNQPSGDTTGVRDRGTELGTPSTDARGFTRWIDTHVDIGAFEFQDADVTLGAGPGAPGGHAYAGLPVGFSFTVTNHGPNPSHGVTVATTLPPGTTVVAASGNFTVSGNVVAFAVPDIAAGASTVLTLTVIPAAGGSFSAAAALSSHDDPNLTNNTASASLTLLPRPFPTAGFADVTGLVQVALQGRRRPRKQFLFRLTNTSGTPIQGPVGVVVAGLPRRVKLRNASGRTASRQTFVRLDVGGDNILDPGESTTFRLVFSQPMNPRALRVLAGTFA
jgi:uncharacterized repeat protein (TIGR01451 family)